MSDNIMTPEFRVSFANVFRPQKKDQPTDPDKYGLTLLFPHPSKMTPAYKAEYDAFMVKAKAALNAAAIAKFGAERAQQLAAAGKLRLPFRDQGEKTFDGYEAGAVFVNATAYKVKPGLVDPANNDIINESDFYSGCHARCSLQAFAYETKGNTGVAFGVVNIQKLRDDEPLGGRIKAQDEFEPVAAVAGPDDGSAAVAGQPSTGLDIFS